MAMADDLKTAEILNYFDENHELKPDVPDEIKLIVYLGQFYTAFDLITDIHNYLKAHPKAIDVKVTDIIEICKKIEVDAYDKSNKIADKMQKEAEKQAIELDKRLSKQI